MVQERYSIKNATQNLFVHMFDASGTSYELLSENNRTVFHNEKDVINMYEFITDRDNKNIYTLIVEDNG